MTATIIDTHAMLVSRARFHSPFGALDARDMEIIRKRTAQRLRITPEAVAAELEDAE